MKTHVALSPVTAAYLEHGAALRRWIGRFTDGIDVDDIAQEAFLRAYRVEQTRPIEQPKSFLFRIAKHAALDRDVRNKRWCLTELDENSLEQCSPEDEAMADEAVMQRIRVIAELPPQAQRVYLLRRYEGLSQEETAAQLGLTESTIEKHIQRERHGKGSSIRVPRVRARGKMAKSAGTPGRRSNLSPEQKLELRLAFKDFQQYGQRHRFYTQHGQRLGVSHMTIKRAVRG